MNAESKQVRTIDAAPAHAAFEKALAEHTQEFGNFFLLRLLGMSVAHTEDSCTVELDVNNYLFNPQGMVHGGVTATMLDISMGHLVERQIGRAVTLELKVQYLNGIRVGPARAVGTFLKRGRSICFTESRLYDAEGALAAMATATWKILADPKNG